MESHAKTSFERLAELLDIMEWVEAQGFLLTDDKSRLRLMVADILNTGLEVRNVDLHDPASGALAEHAFAVLSRELIPLHPRWKEVIESVKDRLPHPPSRRP